MKTPNDDIEQWIKDIKESELIDLWDGHHDPEGLLEAYETAGQTVIPLPDTDVTSENPPF